MGERSVRQAPTQARVASAVLDRRAAALSLLDKLGLDARLLRFAFGVFVLSRLGFIAITALTLRFAMHARVTAGTFLDAWYQWDATFYGLIAQAGYHAGRYVDRTAFFPLQALAIRLAAPLTGGNVAWAGLLVANLSYAVALAGVAALATHDVDGATARRAMLYLTLFPTAFFFFAGYSESLFLAMAVWSFLCMRRRWWWQAGALGLLAGLTRQMGVFLIFPFAWEYGASIGWRLRHVRPDALWGGLTLAGPMLFMGWLGHAVGDPLSFVHVERIWHHVLAPPWTTLAWALAQLPLQLDRTLVFRGLVDLGAVLVFGGLVLFGIRRLPPGDTLYSAAIWLLVMCYPALNWALQSDARYMLSAFPCLLLLAREGRRPWLNALILAVFTALLVVMTQYFVRGRLIL